jgi:hypothetical protein
MALTNDAFLDAIVASFMNARTLIALRNSCASFRGADLLNSVFFNEQYSLTEIVRFSLIDEAHSSLSKRLRCNRDCAALEGWARTMLDEFLRIPYLPARRKNQQKVLWELLCSLGDSSFAFTMLVCFASEPANVVCEDIDKYVTECANAVYDIKFIALALCLSPHTNRTEVLKHLHGLTILWFNTEEPRMIYNIAKKFGIQFIRSYPMSGFIFFRLATIDHDKNELHLFIIIHSHQNHQNG